MEEKCISAEIIPANNKSFMDIRQAMVVMHFPTQPDYKFSFWEEQISFRPDELVGLTKKEASDLYTAKEHAYAQQWQQS